MRPEYEMPAQRSCGAANLPFVDEEIASADVAALYEQYRAQFGRTEVPGILRCFATHPPLLRAMMDLAGAMLFCEGALTRRHKEMIAAFVSLRNGCAYCADSHGYFFRQQGGTDTELSVLREDRIGAGELQEGERSLLEFARKINANSQEIGPADVETLRLEGWSDLQIAETIHTVALFAAFNRIANAFGLPAQGLLSLAAEPFGNPPR